MELIPGKKAGSTVYAYEGYTYGIDTRNRSIYRCSCRRNLKCRGAITVKHDGSISVLEVHNHAGKPFLVTQRVMTEEMFKLCRESLRPTKDIFDSICRKYPDASAHLSFVSMKSRMNREREKCRPPVPDSIASLGNFLESYEPLAAIYKGTVTSVDDETAIILSSNSLVEGLSLSSEMFVDGTFSVLPRQPHMAQLYTIHMRYMDTGIASIFVLCEKRTTALYNSIWQKVIELVPVIKENIKFVMSDYERAALTALSKKFPAASLHGCWFHFNQAILRKWRRLGLTNAPKDVLSMAMNLPLAPAERFQEGLSILQNKADLICHEYPTLLQFMTYMRTIWLPMASQVSVHGCPVRTNNIVESFHNIAVQKLGKNNINIWTFLDKLKTLIMDQEIDFARLKAGHTARRPRTRANRERNTKIRQAQLDLAEERLPLEQFLHIFKMNDEIHQVYQQGLLQSDNNDDPEIINPSLFTAETIDDQDAENNNDNSDIVNPTVISAGTIGVEDIDNNNDGTEVVNTSFFFAETIRVQDTEQIEESTNGGSTRHSHRHSVVRLCRVFSLSDDDEHDLEVPEDDYGYWYGDKDAVESEIPFYPVENPLMINNKENSIQRPEGTCTVCLDDLATQICVPCGHLICCNSCVKQLQNDQCPICQTKFQMCIKLVVP